MPIFYPPPQPTFSGGQPLTNKKLAQGAAVVVSDNPPFERNQLINMLAQAAKAWEPGPPLPNLQNHGPLVQGAIVASDNPPALNRQWFDTVARQWEEWRPRPLWGSILVVDNPTVSDNPPFGLPQFLAMQNILLGWAPAPPLPARPDLLLLPSTESVDNPPFGIDRLRQLAQLLRAWESPAPLPTLPRFQVQPFVFVPTEPPYGINAIRTLHTILRAWEPGPPQPQQKPPEQAINNPATQSLRRRQTKFWYRSG